jgi:hypothetical protein
MTSNQEGHQPSPDVGEPKGLDADVENVPVAGDNGPESPKTGSAFKSLVWLDRFLAIWILLAMIIGVLLGNFVPETGPALLKGQFVGVSVPIGMQSHSIFHLILYERSNSCSCRTSRHDVSDSVQGPLRDSSRTPVSSSLVEADLDQCDSELDCCSLSYGSYHLYSAYGKAAR